MTLDKVTLDFIDTGAQDFTVLQQLLDDIVDEINNNKTAVDTELAALKRTVTSRSQMAFIDYSDYSTVKVLVPAKAHLRMRLDSAYILITDNHKRESSVVLRKGNHEEPLTEELTVKENEKAGRARPFIITPRREIGPWDSVEIVADKNRRLVVVANFVEVD